MKIDKKDNGRKDKGKEGTRISAQCLNATRSAENDTPEYHATQTLCQQVGMTRTNWRERDQYKHSYRENSRS